MFDLQKIVDKWSIDKGSHVMLPWLGSTTCGEAATAIADALRQIAELQAERAKTHRQALDNGMELCRQRSRAVAAEAENARLRALPLKDEVERVLRKARDETMGEAGVALLDKSIDGRIRANWLGGKANGLSTALDILSRLRAGEQEGWRPIKTAPYDGTKFLAFEGGRYFDCWWHDAGYGEAYWMDEANSEPSPNYWRPLPAAPSEQGGDRG